MSNTATKLLTKMEINNIINEIYLKHPQLEILRLKKKSGFETDLQRLKCLPENTLGYHYATHMLENNLDPQFYAEASFKDHQVSENRWEFFRVYSLQSHDIWHVLTGYKTDYLGEIGIFSFLFGQIPLGLYLLIPVSIAMHTILGRKRQDCLKAFENLSHGFNLGKKAKSCIGLDWDQHWQRDLKEIRTELALLT